MDSDDDNRLLLRPSILGHLGLFLGCAAFVVAALVTWKGEFMGWFAVCFFGLGLVLPIVQMMPNASYLLLTEDGFESCSLYRTWKVSWDEIEFFGTVNIGHNNMVAFNFSDRYDRSKFSSRLASIIAGYEGALPDTYGMKADDLARLMSEWKTRFGDRQGKRVNTESYF
jgi:hypothetical protein